MSMKHIGGRAEINGWAMALSEAVDTGKITSEVASYLAARAGEFVVAFATGACFAGYTLSNMEADDIEFFEELEAQANAAAQGYPNA